MNNSPKQHLAIKNLSPPTGTFWFARQMAVEALGRCVGMLMRSQEEEQEEQPDDEPMPVVVAILLRRVDELTAQHAGLEEDIRQIERERKRQGALSSLALSWLLAARRPKGNPTRRSPHHECLTRKI